MSMKSKSDLIIHPSFDYGGCHYRAVLRNSGDIVLQSKVKSSFRTRFTTQGTGTAVAVSLIWIIKHLQEDIKLLKEEAKP